MASESKPSIEPAVAPPDAADPMRDIVERVRRITRENERLFQQLIAGERRFRGLAKAVWKVQEDERRRLARELHDGLGQTLTALKNDLERLGRKLDEALPEELGRQLAGSLELARGALQETRELSRLLRPPVLDDLGLVPALTWLARTMEQRAGLRVELQAAGLDGERLDPEVETLVFRVVQEALTNVLKHAAAGSAEVRLARRDPVLELTVSDAGRGFDPLSLAGPGDSPGSGLRGMRDRVELFGGRFRVRSAPGEGTVLTAEVPLSEVIEAGEAAPGAP